MVNSRSNSCSSQEERNNMTVDKKLNLLTDEVRQLKHESVTVLKRKVAASEQYSRSNCLKITDVPEARTDSRLAKNPSKPESPRGIICKFCCRIDMEEMRRQVKVKRSINAAELGYHSENKIFVNLSLSRDTRHLWAEVMKFKTEHD
ncbi:hypothetical protein J6590_019472 [Homalodisca vitripennis]|nr:hypothetical protein J6590_019472 [Homalodisca vitripennis]